MGHAASALWSARRRASDPALRPRSLLTEGTSPAQPSPTIAWSPRRLSAAAPNQRRERSSMEQHRRPRSGRSVVEGSSHCAAPSDTASRGQDACRGAVVHDPRMDAIDGAGLLIHWDEQLPPQPTFLGSCFAFGDERTYLTAGHCVPDDAEAAADVYVLRPGRGGMLQVLDVRRHPTADLVGPTRSFDRKLVLGGELGRIPSWRW